MKGLMKMKAFLRNRETGKYHAGSNEWSGNASVAQDYETVESAVQLARTQRLAVIEVVLRYDDPACELVFPLRKES